MSIATEFEMDPSSSSVPDLVSDAELAAADEDTASELVLHAADTQVVHLSVRLICAYPLRARLSTRSQASTVQTYV